MTYYSGDWRVSKAVFKCSGVRWEAIDSIISQWLLIGGHYRIHISYRISNRSVHKGPEYHYLIAGIVLLLQFLLDCGFIIASIH